jgi:hypothetical protein
MLIGSCLAKRQVATETLMAPSLTSFSLMSLTVKQTWIALEARSEPVLAYQSRQWLLRSGHGWVLVLFGSFVLIDLSQALVITYVARYLDHPGIILFIALWDNAHAALSQHLACKEPPCNGVEAQ